jgi:GNAT superfamily N-acetyltransferase
MNAAQLRQALASCLGRTLTPELAAWVEAQALQAPDMRIDCAALGGEEFQGYTIRAEPLRDVLHELHPLHVLHWGETEKHRHGLPLAPDYEGMLARERAGRLVQFVVRKDGAIAAHLRMYLAVSMHSGTRFAEEDTLFVHPAHRGSLLALRLLRFAERALLSLGVREIRANSKLVNNADVLMRRMGYQQVAIQFVKIFGEDQCCSHT